MPTVNSATITRDRRIIIKGFGILLLLVGFTGAVFGPLEMYAFYLFSEGGRFHYPGFISLFVGRPAQLDEIR